MLLSYTEILLATVNITLNVNNADAKSRNITSYKKLYTTLDIMDALVNKQPVVIAVDVYDNFMLVDSFNSTIPMPGNSTYYGGHAMCIVGYDISTARFLVKNSFGTEWGDKRYCWMPFLYAEKYVFEKWVFNISDPTILHS